MWAYIPNRFLSECSAATAVINHADLSGEPWSGGTPETTTIIICTTLCAHRYISQVRLFRVLIFMYQAKVGSLYYDGRSCPICTRCFHRCSARIHTITSIVVTVALERLRVGLCSLNESPYQYHSSDDEDALNIDQDIDLELSQRAQIQVDKYCGGYQAQVCVTPSCVR